MKIIIILWLAMASFCLVANSSPWRICAVYPHLKDSYWLSINFGMIKQAKQRAIKLKVLEAGGYGNSDSQWQQIEHCRKWQADAILFGSVLFDPFSEQLGLINRHTPLFGLVNEVDKVELTASIGVSWDEMGFKLGKYLAKIHPASTPTVRLAWFPGPLNGGGSEQATTGLIRAIKGSAIELVTIEYGLNDNISQFSLIKSVLTKYPNIDYLAGNAVMAEMAISEVSAISAQQRPKILSHYFSHGVYRGIARGKIMMANTDQMVLQGKMAINQVIDYLDGRDIESNQGPKILTIDPTNIDKFTLSDSLSPSDYKPSYQVN